MNFSPKKNKKEFQGAGSYLPAPFFRAKKGGLHRNRIAGLFWGMEFLLYIWFLAEDALGQTWLLPSDTVKYISICLCAVFAWIQYGMLCARGKAGRIWMPLAQSLILPADWILLFHNEWTTVGIAFFLAVQICYGIRILLEERERGKKPLARIAAGYSVQTLGVIVFLLIIEEWMIRDRGSVVLLGLVYGAFFVHHVGMALVRMIRHPRTEHILFAVGLVLFLLCDIHVAYWFGTCQGMFTGAALQYGKHFAWFAMWLFYLPGQVLLVRSNWYPTATKCQN